MLSESAIKSKNVSRVHQFPWPIIRTELIDEKGLEESTADRIGGYVQLSGKNDLVNQLLSDEKLNRTPEFVRGLNDIRLLLNYCDILAIKPNIVFDLSLARGLDYYTGVIYEAVLNGIGFVAFSQS